MNEIKKLLLNNGATKTVEGVPPLTLERSKGKDLKGYKIYGKSQQGENLFKKETATLGKNLNATAGTLYNSSARCVSDYIEVDSSKEYIFIYNPQFTATRYACCYDENKNYLGESKTAYTVVQGDSTSTMTIKFLLSEVKYIRANCYWSESGVESEIDDFVILEGSPTPENPIEIESVGDKTVNLADLSKATNGHFVDNGYGSFTLTKVSNSSRFSEELYPVIPANTTFYIKAKILEYTGTYSQKLQLQVHLMDGSTKYINNPVDDFQGKYTYTSAVKDMRLYSDSSNPDGTFVTFTDFIISTEDVPYEPYDKYKIPIISRSKNLFDKYNWFPEFIDDDGNIRYTNNDYSKIYSRKILEGKYKEKTQYTFSVKYELTKKQEADYGVILHMALSDGSYVVKRLPDAKQVGTYTGECFVTNPTGTTVSKITLSYNNQNYSAEVVLWDVQIEEGANATEYEPYAESTKTNIYLDEPLRKIGDYTDYIDFANKKVVRNIKEYILTSNNPCEKTGPNANNLNRFAYSIYNTGIIFDSYTTLNALCNIFHNYAQSFSSASKKNIFFPQYSPTGSATLYICVDKDEYPEIADIRALVDNTVKFYIPWGVVEEILEFPNIPTIKGTTIIELDTKINASKMKVKYKKG